MEPFISPPTDNVYKFIAIGGLALVIVAVVLDIKLIDPILELREEAHATFADDGTTKPTDAKEAARKQRIAEQSEVLMDRQTFHRRMLWSGILFAGAGFAAWFLFVQRKEDRLLSLQIEELEQRVGKTP